MNNADLMCILNKMCVCNGTKLTSLVIPLGNIFSLHENAYNVTFISPYTVHVFIGVGKRIYRRLSRHLSYRCVHVFLLGTNAFIA